MIALSLRFPTGRMHATPWGRQVNEGVVEWPFSPWRILRALIATWHHKTRDAVEESVLRSLVEGLAAEAPVYHLPDASTGHTRHYMPYIEGPNQKTTKVFDTFVHIQAGQRVEVTWPNLELAAEERGALRILLERLGYFGRAESLVEAKIEDRSMHPLNARPLRDGEVPNEDEELIRLIAPMSAAEYRLWCEGYEAARARTAPGPNAKRKGKFAEVVLPANLFEALLADTGELKRAGWNQPPGSRWIDYARPRDTFEMAARRRSAASSTGTTPTVARFVVASNVLPRLTQAISVAERIHQSLVKLSDNAPVFTGLDDAGRPLHGHRHARILCECSSHQGTISQITIYAPMGFDTTARRALDKLHKVWGHGGHDLQLILLGVGQREDFAKADAARGQRPLMAESSEWRSLTPFVPTRHAKARRNGQPKLDGQGLQIGSPEHDLCRLIKEGGLPRPAEIERMVVGQLGGKPIRWLAFQRERGHGNGSHAGQMGYGFRLTFSKLVRGPLAFGYASHFGLGLFVPAEPGADTEGRKM